MAALTNANYEASNATGTLTINKAAATLTLGSLIHTYDMSPKAATVATSPVGLTVVSITYDGSPTPPTNAGNYAVVASLTNANYDAPNVTGTLVISKAAATLTLADLTHTYDGSPKQATATTSPTGLPGVSIAYDGSSTAPTNAGSYAVVASLTNANYDAPNATATLVISKAAATLTLADLTHTYSGSPQQATATTSPAGLSGVSITYDGSPTAPTNAGSYAVVASLTNANYDAPNATATLVISKAVATLTLADLTHTYNGSPRQATATTSPAGLSGLSITYDGSPTAPTNAGSYAVVASLTNANYDAPNATATLVISKALATLTLADLTHTYNGSPQQPTATTSPTGLTGVAITYDGSASAPTNVGSYAVVASLTNANYDAPNATGTLVITKATATITLSGLTHTFDGSPKAASATTTPAALTALSITYNGSPTVPTNAGSYAVVVSLMNANYEAPNATGTLVISKATATITLGGLTHTFDGSPKAASATTTPTALTALLITYNGSPTAPTNAGGYAVVVSLTNANYEAPNATGTLTIAKANQTIVVTTGAPATAAFGTSFTVAATGGGSGNAVMVTTPPGDGCSDTGPTFTITSGIAVCQVVYNQAGNANYTAAPQIVQTVTPIGYAFEGFFSPIDMSTSTTVWNQANAGQAIPAKWRLTLGGLPVASGASFVGLFSYEVNCSSGAGDIVDAIEEYAPGASGLIYDGDGRFHFNWKTPKTYANKCRAMYVSFSDGSSSPVASFKFK